MLDTGAVRPTSTQPSPESSPEPSERPAVSLTIGNFDGVHLGHAALLKSCRNTEVHALFFDPHPRSFFRAESAPRLLTSVETRRKRLLAAGATHVDVQAFDKEFASMSPEAFVHEVIADRHRASQVVVGPDFRFGQKAAGDTELLRALGPQLGFDVTVVGAVELGGEVVSSTRIRKALSRGDLAEAEACLGRPFSNQGTVVQGDQRGRTIGFPTANLQVERTLAVPADGVYAAVVFFLGSRHRAMVNVGVRPTFDAGRSLEVHVFDFDGDLYGETLEVCWRARLRDEQRFSGVDALVAQLQEDAKHAQALLEGREEMVCL